MKTVAIFIIGIGVGIISEWIFVQFIDWQISHTEMTSKANEIVNDPGLKSLSAECVKLIEADKKQSWTRGGFEPQGDWATLPPHILALRPDSVYADSQEVRIFYRRQYSWGLALSCNNTGALWISGAALPGGGRQIYPKIDQPNKHLPYGSVFNSLLIVH